MSSSQDRLHLHVRYLQQPPLHYAAAASAAAPAAAPAGAVADEFDVPDVVDSTAAEELPKAPSVQHYPF